MAEHEAAGAQVLVFGWLTDVSGSIAAALERDGIGTRHAHPPWTGSPAVPLSRAEVDSIESVIAIFDGDGVQSLFAGRPTRASRRRVHASANDVRELMISTALTVGARRVLLVCDTRRLPFGRRPDAVRWTRNLAHRIGYECMVNGLPDHSALHAVIDTDDDVRDVADAVAAWHRGRPADQRRQLHRAVGAVAVTPASSTPHRSPPS